MQKNFSPNPCGRKNPFFHARYSSASTNQLQVKQPQLRSSVSEIESFASQFSKVMQEYLPSYNLPYSKNLLYSILQTLPKALETFSVQVSNETEEKYQEQQEALARMSRNLVKYEELLTEKAQKLEADFHHWQRTKEAESSQLEIEKSEIITAKVKLEFELKNASETLQSKEHQIMVQLNEINVLQIQLHKEKLQGEELKWKLDQLLSEVKDREAILEMKGRMLSEEKDEFISEKSRLENQKFVNEMLANEFVRSRASPIKRPESCVVSEVSKLLESPHKLTPHSWIEDKFESSFSLEKTAFINFVNCKNALEKSAEELQDIKTKILPDMHKNSETLLTLIGQLTRKKEKIKKVLKVFNEKLEVFSQKEEEIEQDNKKFEEMMKNAENKTKVLEESQREFQEQKEVFEELKHKLQVDFEGFQQEKIEFYEEMHEERKRIEEYYVGIEEKVKVLEMRRVELQNSKKN